jgi:catechol 2,3-dioxygenase-like lactoylglutathione lyase family enzyme
MKFRSARHTNDLAPIIAFYTEMLGLQVLGQFEGHAGYDGVFLGYPENDWHLEFTVSGEAALHHPDEDDLLVFYAASAAEYESILLRFADRGILPVDPKNPYWKSNGTTYADPDGYRLVIAMPQH